MTDQATPQSTFRRSVTLPTRFQPTAKAGTSDNASTTPEPETLFAAPTAKIVSFAASLDRPSSAAGTPKQDTPGTLPWSKSSERVAAAGPIRLYHVPGSVSFLNSGNLLLSLLPRSQCWCVDGQSKFAMKIQTYIYRFELPFETEEDKTAVEEFEKVLDNILQYEKTPCPFKRHFYVELPEETNSPVARRRKGSFKKAKRWEFNQGWIPEGADPSDYRRTQPVKSNSPVVSNVESRPSTAANVSYHHSSSHKVLSGKPVSIVQLRPLPLDAYRSITSPPKYSFAKSDPFPQGPSPSNATDSIKSSQTAGKGAVELQDIFTDPGNVESSSKNQTSGLSTEATPSLALRLESSATEPLRLVDQQPNGQETAEDQPAHSMPLPPLAPTPQSQSNIHPITPPESVTTSDHTTGPETPPQSYSLPHKADSTSSESPSVQPQCAVIPAPSRSQPAIHHTHPKSLADSKLDLTTPPQTPISSDWTPVSPPSTPPSTIRSRPSRIRGNTSRPSRELTRARTTSTRSFTTALFSTTYALLMAPPSSLVAVMMQIAARIANGAFGASTAGAYRYQPGRGPGAAGWIPGGWEDSESESGSGKRDSEDGWAGSGSEVGSDEEGYREDEDDYGVAVGCDTPARARRKAWGSAAAAATGRRGSSPQWEGARDTARRKQDRKEALDVD